MMKHNLLILLLGALGLQGCINGAMAGYPIWILDDTVMELTPEYNVQHVQGAAYSDVYAAFTSVAQRKLVRLRSGDRISVNGRVLEEMSDAKGYYYQTHVPDTEGVFTFTLSRNGKVMTHSFELPVLGIGDPPKVYRPYERVHVPVDYREPPEYVTRDTYDFSIYGPDLRFPLVSTTRSKNNPYEVDRLPDIRNGAIVFRHILDRAPPPGIYPARIYRQQHVALSKMSNASRTGWATLSISRQFMVEVKEGFPAGRNTSGK